MRKIALIISLIGIISILFIINNIDPPYKNINEINEDLLEKSIKISGKIGNIKNLEEFSIFDISDQTGKITVFCECQLKNVSKAEIIGRVNMYENKLEIVADKIIYIK